MTHSQIWNSMFLLLLPLFVVTYMRNKMFWFFIAESPLIYTGNGNWSLFSMAEGTFFLYKEGGVGKTVERWRSLKESNL